MPALVSDLRKQLESVCVHARDLAETAARAALKRLGVEAPKPFPHFSKKQKELRNRLRARGRQAGDRRRPNGEQEIEQLAQELAYEYWHRMLFARFLAENHLLMHPDGVPVSLADCDELAKIEGAENGWVLAAWYASRMLPQIFRTDDPGAPGLEVEFPINDRLPLEKLLASLPSDTFTADDSLGWVYQFWQTKKKDEVNRSEVKIGADELPAVTQLFTEPYMVQFLLHNTLGAWWAGKKMVESRELRVEGQNGPVDLFAGCADERECRRRVAVPGVNWEYLRFVRTEAECPTDSPGPQLSTLNPQLSWRPAAGTFDGWPKTAAELKVLDPCCGSGHFLVAALHHLVAIRMAEEGSSAREAADAVLRDNLHGLEIDHRCCQIAAFALAMEAWKMTGYRELPPLHIACTGIGPQATEEQWLKLAEQSGKPMPRGRREPIQNGLLNLHHLFSQAPTLGSLINPTELPADLIAADYETIQPYLSAILSAEKSDDETRERAIAAAGMAKAAELLAGEYTLVITNVPYLGRGKQDDVLKAHLEEHYPEGKADLATAFVLRCLDLCECEAADAENASVFDSVNAEGVSQHSPGSRVFEHTLGDEANGNATNPNGVVQGSTSCDASVVEPFQGSLDHGVSTQPRVRSQTRDPGLRCSTPSALAVGGEPITSSDAALRARAPRTGTAALVTPQNWLFLTTYTKLRESLLKQRTWNLFARLGPGAFETISGEVVNAVLLALTATTPREATTMAGIDVAGEKTTTEKANKLIGNAVVIIGQKEQLNNPDQRVSTTQHDHNAVLLGEIAECYQGVVTGDLERFRVQHWEVASGGTAWVPFRTSLDNAGAFEGLNASLFWQDGTGQLHDYARQTRDQLHDMHESGNRAWNRIGIAVNRMQHLRAGRYLGEIFDNNVAVIVPFNLDNLPALAAFCESAVFCECVRSLDQTLKVTNRTLVKVPFDLAHWQKVAAEKYANGLPEPESDDPTQWLFHGRPEESTAPLQVAVARLLGYRWPAELEGFGEPGGVSPRTARSTPDGPGADAHRLAESTNAMRLSQRARALVRRCAELARFADTDGIVCIPSVRGEEPAAERLLGLLRAAFASLECGDSSPLSLAAEPPSMDSDLRTIAATPQGRWAAIQSGDESPHSKGTSFESWLHDLLTAEGCKPATSLDDWLRTAFFEQHCKLFHNRPFIWHIWDGRKDGFSCLVNYHRLNYKTLENVTYSYLGDWIKAQAAAAKHGKPGTDLRLAAAQELQNKLKLILEGEPPYDIFVRWKPIHEQPIGWNPDLNDGVRVNIRPFVEAGVLRKNPNVKWTKDRGKEPKRDKDEYPWFWNGKDPVGDRVNHVHLTNAEKQTARNKKGDD